MNKGIKDIYKPITVYVPKSNGVYFAKVIVHDTGEKIEWLDESQSPSTEVKGQQGFTPDKKYFYVSPSGEQIQFYNGSEWKQYIRTDALLSQPQEGQDELYNKGYADGYRDATNEARKEIHDHYRPNNEH